jgi:hypothetical protein
MAVAVALIVALFLGLVADLATAVVVRAIWHGGSVWWPLAAFGTDVRLLVMNQDRISVVEAFSAGLGLLGGTLAAAAAVGAAPGSAAFVYLALALGALGGHAASSLSDIGPAELRAKRARFQFVMVEPAFALALAVGFIRWRAVDLEAVRGAHDVLGSGTVVGPPLASIGLILAALVVVFCGALRLAPERAAEPGTGGGSSLLVTMCRWSLSGATVLVAAAFLAGGENTLTAAWPLDTALLPGVLTAVGGALLFGGVRAAFDALPWGMRLLAGWAAVLLAAVALELVLLA